MRSITLERRMEASRSAVWAILADYPNISSWNSGVTESYSTSEATEGVGATRHCDLKPLGALEETIRHWEPESKLVISIDEAAKLPIKRGEVTFSMEDAGDACEYSMRYDYEPKGGIFAKFMGPILDRQLKSGFTGFIDDLETAAKAQPAAD